ncbi:hypothetical protein BDV26DRAFT_172368 [Aspergillus bertholletiae]|uniref:Secreted protein n=1 Tax=Aspergillus bertholletiae TaxID=1226010 RepID=A0A5N7BC29_9EURO|nr:hypothetical protein BDV26DRAFT_172368 [Aspergillus bertholletiae]
MHLCTDILTVYCATTVTALCTWDAPTPRARAIIPCSSSNALFPTSVDQPLCLDIMLHYIESASPATPPCCARCYSTSYMLLP